MERVSLSVAAFVYDDWNQEHMLGHDVKPEDLDEVLHNAPRFFTNWPDRTASHVMLGPDNSGAFIFAAIDPTNQDGVWYPLTAHWMARRRALRIYDSG